MNGGLKIQKETKKQKEISSPNMDSTFGLFIVALQKFKGNVIRKFIIEAYYDKESH